MLGYWGDPAATAAALGQVRRADWSDRTPQHPAPHPRLPLPAWCMVHAPSPPPKTKVCPVAGQSVGCLKQRERPCLCRTAGCAPVTWRCWMPTASAPSWDDARTSSSGVGGGCWGGRGGWLAACAWAGAWKKRLLTFTLSPTLTNTRHACPPLVLAGGENLFPREVEEFLHQHPAVADVQVGGVLAWGRLQGAAPAGGSGRCRASAAVVCWLQVFGVPDERMGEELCAWVRLRRVAAGPGTDCLGQRCGTQRVPRLPLCLVAGRATATWLSTSCGRGARAASATRRSHATSRQDAAPWGFRLRQHTGVVTSPPCRTPAQVVDAFPTTASGKPQKFCMREAAVAELGLQAAQQLVATA